MLLNLTISSQGEFESNRMEFDLKREYVTPGESITNDPGFMRYFLIAIYLIFKKSSRGHGTYSSDEIIVSSVAGMTERVNKLVSVRALKSRYSAEIGDLVVGRIVELGSKRWRVDCNGRQDSVLLLSSIHLPGAIQRRRSESDELQMRSFFNEGEILVAEVQMLYHDGAFGIHTRNLKYGKLVTGELIAVRSGLVKRSRSHFHIFSWGVEVILGLNGYIWIGKPRKSADEQDLDSIYASNLDSSLSLLDREAIARTRNCIVALDRSFKYISGESVTNAYHVSLKFSIRDILLEDNLRIICSR